MKKIILYAIGGCLLITACRQRTDFDGLRPDERLSETLTQYETQLVEADYGWLGYLFPAGGGGYTFKFTFEAANRVTMFANINETYATTAKESSYRLRATQIPSLYFDTYSYLHQLADPDPAKNGGTPGQGLLSDFEFSIVAASADTIHLKGNLNGSELLLVRAEPDQDDAYIAEAYAYQQEIARLSTFRYYHHVMEVGEERYQVVINTDINTISILYDDNGFHAFTTAYTTLDNGILLRNAFTHHGTTIHSLTDFEINNTTYTTQVLLDGTQSARLVNRATPLVTDPDAANRMYLETTPRNADDAFIVNGQKDGLGLSALPGFRGVQLYPRFYTNGYDAFFAYYNDANTYVGPALKTQVDDAGKIHFTDFVLQASDPASVPEAAIPVLAQVMAQLAREEGFYIYQTGEKNYDMVSAADGGVWIRFR